MIKILFALIVVIHGLIHIMGFVKAFQLADVSQLTQSISKPAGLLWLFASLLFIGAAVGFLLNKEWWWLIATCASVLSQVLIVLSWQDAKFGTIANVIVLIAAVLGFAAWNFQNAFQRDVKDAVEHSNSSASSLLTETDFHHLPAPVQKYLKYVGVLDKERARNMRIVFDGKMRDVGKEWFEFQSEQYNCFDVPSRFFFMQAKMMGVSVAGYHAFKNGNAAMLIKLLSLVPIVNAKGDTLDIAETVTVFNDMCLFAPATLIDKRIEWKTLDSNSVRATFSHNGKRISAELFFNNEGQLTNFVSADRYYIAPDKTLHNVRWSTPMSEYRNVSGFNLPTHGETVWSFPDGDFCYGKFTLKEIEYNKR